MKRKAQRQRNPFHDHPLMQKGGVHDKSNKAKRKNAKQQLRKEWCCLMALILVALNNSTHKGAVA